MAYGVTSQWDDIQRKLGNLPELPPEVKQEELVNAAVDFLEGYDPLEHKTKEELDELEDEVEDDVLTRYRE
jgi:hypothetical protein